MALAVVGANTQTLAPGQGTPSFGVAYSSAASVLQIIVLGMSAAADYLTVSGITGDGLTWQRRSQTKMNSAYSSPALPFQNVEVWWAWAPSTQTAKTATVSIATNNSTSHDNIAGHYFQVSGSTSGTAPWDDNASAEANAIYSDAAVLSGANFGPGITVNQTNDMILSFVAEQTSTGSSSLATVGSGYTSISTLTRGSSPNQFHVAAQQKVQAGAGAAAGGWASATGKLSYITVTDALTGTSTGTANPAGLAIHGTPAHTSDVTGAVSSVSASITTTLGNCVIIAVIEGLHQLAASSVKTVTGVSGGGLTWAKRKAVGDNGSNIFMGLEVWWAYAASPLTAQSITATFNAAPNQACDIMVFAVSGSPNPSSPWDANVSLPCSNTHMVTGSHTTPTQNGTVTNTNSMLLEFLAFDNNALTTSVVGVGFNDIRAAQATGSLRSNWGYQISASAGSKTFGFVNNQDFWLVIGDALAGDPVIPVTEPKPVVCIMQ